MIKQLSPINTGPFKITNGSIIADLEIKTGPLDSSIITSSLTENELSMSLKKRSILAIHCHGNLRPVSYTHLTLPTICSV